MKMSNTISWNDFEKVDIRTGTIVEVSDFPNARKPSYQLTIDFGELGIKKSSAQITHHYTKEELIGRQIVAVVNFPVKQIANFFSECLVLGVYDTNKDVVLLQPGKTVQNGGKIG
jgi:tRNA-binding protein